MAFLQQDEKQQQDYTNARLEEYDFWEKYLSIPKVISLIVLHHREH